MANEFETLLKTDTEPNIEIESETAAKPPNTALCPARSPSIILSSWAFRVAVNEASKIIAAIYLNMSLII